MPTTLFGWTGESAVIPASLAVQGFPDHVDLLPKHHLGIFLAGLAPSDGRWAL